MLLYELSGCGFESLCNNILIIKIVIEGRFSKLHKRGQNIVVKFTRLSKIGVSLQSFTAGFL